MPEACLPGSKAGSRRYFDLDSSLERQKPAYHSVEVAPYTKEVASLAASQGLRAAYKLERVA